VVTQGEYTNLQRGPYNELCASLPEQTLVPVDFCYAVVLQRKAFLQSHRKDFEPALETLAREVRIAPAAAAPWVERGFVQNQMHRPEEARASYEHAVELARRHPASKADEPMALRGLGYALVELGDLDGAERAYERSLEIEHHNEVAESELAYIGQLRARH
jgi:Flp pilus assembly protein TadD